MQSVGDITRGDDDLSDTEKHKIMFACVHWKFNIKGQGDISL